MASVKIFATVAFAIVTFFLVLSIFLFGVLLSIYPFHQFIRGYWAFFVIGSAFSIALVILSLRQKSRWESETKAEKCDPLIKPRTMLYFAIASLVVFVTTFIVLTTFAHRSAAYPFENLNFVIIGHVDHNSATIVMRNTDLPLGWIEYKLADDQITDWIATETVQFTSETDYVMKFRLAPLTPTTAYLFRTVVDGLISEQIHSFKTTGLPETNFDFSFTVGSCILATAFMDLKGPARMMATNPDFNLFIGDFIYADHPYYAAKTPQYFHEKYRNVIGDPTMRAFLTRVPSMFMFDDHEFDDNWAGGNQDPLYKTAIAAWELYNGNANPNSTREGVYYYSFAMGQASFFVIDARSYRDPEKAEDNEDKTMLQEQQLNDLLDHLLRVNSTSTFKFLISSIPWSLNAEATDTWYGYQTERKRIFDFIRANNIQGIVFLSGDRHYAGVFELDIGFPELTASPIDAFPGFPATLNENLGETIRYFDNGKNYFGKVDVSYSGDEPQVTLSVYPNDEQPVSFTYKLSELRLK